MATCDALLRLLLACNKARDWAKGKTLREAWDTCERGEWMLWLAARMIGKVGWPTHKDIVLAACKCADGAMRYVPKGENRPRHALAMARKWCRGKATIEEVNSAAYAAYAAAYAASADSAAYAAACAAASASYAAASASSASYAADAADAADVAARTRARLQSASIVRRMLSIPA